MELTDSDNLRAHDGGHGPLSDDQGDDEHHDRNGLGDDGHDHGPDDGNHDVHGYYNHYKVEHAGGVERHNLHEGDGWFMLAAQGAGGAPEQTRPRGRTNTGSAIKPASQQTCGVDKGSEVVGAAVVFPTWRGPTSTCNNGSLRSIAAMISPTMSLSKLMPVKR
jgi:hypothetical protein